MKGMDEEQVFFCFTVACRYRLTIFQRFEFASNSKSATGGKRAKK